MDNQIDVPRRVYVLLESFPYESTHVCGVFSTYELAEIAKLKVESGHRDSSLWYCDIESYELDSEEYL